MVGRRCNGKMSNGLLAISTGRFDDRRAIHYAIAHGQRAPSIHENQHEVRVKLKRPEWYCYGHVKAQVMNRLSPGSRRRVRLVMCQTFGTIQQ